MVGHTIDDSTWHRNDTTVIEEVNITSGEGDMYYVIRNPLKVEIASDVQRYVEIVRSHGWKPFSF